MSATSNPPQEEAKNSQNYPYLTLDVTRNTKGYTVSASARSRPGESDEQTLVRLTQAFDRLELIYPADRN